MSRRLAVLFFAAVVAGCGPTSARPAGHIEIYLPAQPLSGREILAADLSQLKLQPQPIVPADEIVSYSPSTHDLALVPAAVERLMSLRIPVSGLGFVVCLDAQPLFAGAFWTPLSSLSFDGVTIQLFPGTKETHVHLYSGYPSMDSPLPNDPRDDPLFLDALNRDGKLR